MNLMVQECSCRICEILCPGNDKSLLNDITGFLSELPTLKHHTVAVQSMVHIYLKLPPYYIQQWALFVPLAKTLQLSNCRSSLKITSVIMIQLEGNNFLVGILNFHAC